MNRPGRFLVLGFEGTSVPDDLVAFAARFGLAGLILFRKNCPDPQVVSELIRDGRRRLAAADPGWSHLVFVDQEGGRVERIRGGGVPSLPCAAELGGRGGDAVREAARAQAKALAALGVDVNLAPVCDVLQEGESGDIGDRSFGARAEAVAELARAFVAGSREAGVLTCAKHFPGLGSAALNSHRELPVVGKRAEELASLDLVPFRLLAGEVPLVMASHAVYPAVSALAASLSPEWLQGVLRGEFGFGGAVISDDMEMGALQGLGAPGELAARAFRAGCDLLIYGRMLRPEIDAAEIARALAGEEAAAARAEQALARVVRGRMRSA